MWQLITNELTYPVFFETYKAASTFAKLYDAIDITFIPNNRDLAAGDLAAGDLAAGDMAAGDMAAGDMAAGDLAAGDQFYDSPCVFCDAFMCDICKFGEYPF